MRRGFTLLELIVVIIIIGILATLGLTQYTRLIEKARGAEARAILGSLRQKAAAYRLEYGTLAAAAAMETALDISTAVGDTPSACAGQASHYFKYSVSAVADPSITFTAARCGVGDPGGKTPQAQAPTATQTLTLQSNLNTGVDTWAGSGPWD